MVPLTPLAPFFTPADLAGPAPVVVVVVVEGPAEAEAGFRPFGGIVKSQVLVEGCVRGCRDPVKEKFVLATRSLDRRSLLKVA